MILGWKRNTPAPQVGRMRGAKKACPSAIRSRAKTVEWLSEGVFEPLYDDVFRSRADKPPFDATVLEEDQSRNAANIITIRYRWIFVNVEFAHFGAAGIILRDALDRGGHHPARRAPLRPEVHQHRLVRLEHFVIKIAVRQFQRVISCHAPSLPPLRGPSGCVLFRRGPGLATSLVEPFVNLGILFGRTRPRKILLHAVLHQPLPLFRLAVGLEGLPERSEQSDRRILRKLEARARAALERFHRIVESAGGANDRHGAVLHAVNLVEPAWLVTRRHQEEVRPGLDPVR